MSDMISHRSEAEEMVCVTWEKNSLGSPATLIMFEISLTEPLS